MNTNTPSSELVRTAYRLLKQDAYYDKMDMFLRANVAAYEAGDSFQQRQDTLATIVDELHKGAPSPKSQQAIKAWLKHVKFRLLPKSVALPSAHEKQNPATGTKPYLIASKRIVETAKGRVFNVA
jgi:hypothetical protein